MLRRIDLRDPAATTALVEEARPDFAFHLAAQSSVAESWRDPVGTLTVNASAQLNLLQSLSQIAPLARVVVVGSSEEYGNVCPEDNPIPETRELRPASPYALSKVVQDLMGLQYAEVQGMAVVRVRPFLQLGPRRQSHFVAGSFARQIAEAENGFREPLVSVGNLEVRRDFVDVRDVAQAYTAAAERGEPGQVYNIATGAAFAVRDLLETMLARSALHFTIREEDTLRRTTEAPLLTGDTTRFYQATGWSPRVPFAQSVADTLEYWRARVRRAADGGRISR